CRSENDISPVNAEINAKIALLCTKYTCHDNDGSDFCWVSPEDVKHGALGHPHLQHAHGTNDEETPPSHTIFSGNSNSGLASKTLLQHRAAAATNQASTAAGLTIHTHNNFTIPDRFLDLFRPAAIASPQPAPISQPYEPQLTLIPPGKNVEICSQWYRTTAAFRFIELKDLPLIQFLPGEIAELREAVQEWAVAM
ncbi:hypothetical protein B0H14DRAFT_2715583, partial [Mycena olivaceomarginata]